MSLTGRFVILLAVGVVPIVLLGGDASTSFAILAGWLLFSVLLGAIDVAAASPRQVRLAREVPARVRLGEPASARLVVTNTGSRTLRAVVRDGWQPSAGAGDGRHPLVIPTGQARTITMVLRPWRRGTRRVAAVTIRSRGPLGLVSRQATLSAPGQIVVLPPFASRKHLPSRLTRLRELDGRTSTMVRGQGTEFDSLREYVEGDDVRSIDWRASARRVSAEPDGSGSLVVRTWRPERDRRVVIVVDASRTSAARIGDEPRIDSSYESALLLAALASRAGDRVDVLAFDARVRGRVQSTRGADLLSRMVETFAGIEPELVEADWADVPAQVRGATHRRALVVLLTAIDSPGSTTGLLGMLPTLTRRHTVVVAAATDPLLDEAASHRGSRHDVYRAAAAERAMLDTARVSAAVRSLGGEVVTASPADLPPALADRYIALKAAGRL